MRMLGFVDLDTSRPYQVSSGTESLLELSNTWGSRCHSFFVSEGLRLTEEGSMQAAYNAFLFSFARLPAGQPGLEELIPLIPLEVPMVQ